MTTPTPPPAPAPAPTPTPSPVSGNIIYDLVTRLGTAGIAVFVLMQVNSRMQEENRLAREAFIAEGKEMRAMFQTDSEKDRQLHRESLRAVGEQALKQNEKTTAAMDRAIEEMRRATSAMEDSVKAIERSLPMRPGPESRIRPVDPTPVEPPAKPSAVSARMVRAVTSLAVYCSVPLVEPNVDPPVKLGGQPAPHEDPPAPPPPPPPADEPVPLDKQRFRLFWIDNYAGSVPIRWKVIPLDDKAALNLVPVKPGDSIISVIQGEDDFKRHTVPPDKAGAVAVYGRADGLVLLTADGVENDRIVTLLSVRVKVGQGSKPPPVVVNPPEKPVDPQPDKPGPLFFAIIRPDGAVSRDLEKVLANPEWDAHRKAGRSVKVYTASEVADRYPLPNGTRLPCVLTLRISADGKTSTIAREPIDLPTTSDGIRKLNVGIK